MASGPITSWQIVGGTVETVTDFIVWGSTITADGDSRNDIKRGLLLGRKFITNLDSVLKSRDITLSTKVHLVKAMVFSVVIQETWVRSLGWEDPMQKGKATHSCILAWRIPQIQSMRLQRVGHN